MLHHDLAEGLVILFCCCGIRGLVGEASEKIRFLSLQRVSLGWGWDMIRLHKKKRQQTYIALIGKMQRVCKFS